MDRSFVTENNRERERLRSLVSRLKDEELNLPLEDGWTIGAALGHLAFWDQRAFLLMQRWKKNGVASFPDCGVNSFPIDVDVINGAILPLCLAIPPGVAGHLAVSAAEAIDKELENASDELIKAIEGLGGRFRLFRSDHRKMHVDQIESALKGNR